MTKTATQVIDAAAGALGVLGRGLTARDSTNGLYNLNELLQSMDLGQWRTTGDLALTDEVPIPDEIRGGVTAMLAVNWAPWFGVSASPEVIAKAQRGKAQLQSYRLRHGTSVIDPGLLNLPSQVYGRGN